MSLTRSTFSFPNAVIYGPGTLGDLPEHLQRLGVQRPLVVTDPGLLETDAFARLEQVLGAAGRGERWWVCSDVHANPVERNVRQVGDAFKANGCDGVIGLGGGSALDVAKAARLLIRRPQLAFKDYDEGEDWSGLVPFIAIPTTAGTGSEVGRCAVVTLEVSNRKVIIYHPELLANLVFLDAELTRGLPPTLTAATGLDALTHCIEAFTSPVFQPLCDGIALEGIYRIVKALPQAVEHGDDLDARGQMLAAAAMGAVAFQKDLGATHSLAHPLSTLCGMHHGTANAMCLPFVMEFNAQRKPGLYRRVGMACHLDVLDRSDAEADRLTIEFLRAFIEKLGLPLGLRRCGVRDEQIDALTDQAFADSCHATNPVAVTAEDLRNLYLAAL